MVYLLIQIGADRYALEAVGMVVILPVVHLKRIPQAPVGVAGVFNYHGRAVPVVDLSAMALGRSSEESLSTRIVVVQYPTPDGQKRLLGLLAENATETVRYEKADFQDPGISVDGAPYLGPVVHGAQGIVQRVDPSQLLTVEVRDALWRQAEEAL